MFFLSSALGIVSNFYLFIFFSFRSLFGFRLVRNKWGSDLPIENISTRSWLEQHQQYQIHESEKTKNFPAHDIRI